MRYLTAPNPERAIRDPRSELSFRRELREHAALFSFLAACAFAPLVVIGAHVAAHGGVLTGVNGGDFIDQFQYLAWIRDEGSHLAASNLWVIGPTPHDYVHPMYVISGLLWRLGLSLQAAYLIWKPVALLVLFGGFAAYVRHTTAGGRWARLAALALALFYATPAWALSRWTGDLSAAHALSLVIVVNDPNAMVQLWGFEHTALAIGLMPVCLIACERLVSGECQRPGRYLAIAGGAGLLVSWLHPWQGAMLLIVFAGLAALRPPRSRHRVLFPVGVATALPLLYGLILTRSDGSWRAFEHASTLGGTDPAWALALSLGPLVALALVGLRRPRSDRELMLVLWLVACALVYLLVPEFPPHALAGITLPLSVLAVAGWRRLLARLGVARPAGAALTVAAVAAFTVPVLVSRFQDVSDTVSPSLAGGLAAAQYRLTVDEAAAMRYLDRRSVPGGVLAPWLLSLSVPEFTGRPVYVGHLQWEPPGRLGPDGQFFSPSFSDPSGAWRRRLLQSSGARFVLSPCGTPDLTRALAPLAHFAARFGCVSVYEAG